MKNITLSIFLVASLILQGCANLEHVSSFSTTAVKTIKAYDDIGYTFTSSYYDYSLGQNAFALNGDMTTNSLSLPTPLTVPNEPATANEADKAITFYTTSIASYFEALAKLSDKDLVNYNFDDVGANLKADATLKAKLGITSDDKIDAATKIATVFTNKLMGAYREKKIRNVMIDYDTDVSKSIQTLIDIINKAVLPAIKNDNGLVDVKYQVILKNPKVDISKKAELTSSYNDEKIKLDKYKIQMEQLVKALSAIKDEHTKTAALLKDRKLTAQDVKDIINKHAAEVYQFYKNIKLLTTKSN
ncbi:hypothetical protein FMM05_20300 [Flavobacterium zepuense]|uniref:Lipoprotein n=1 Tax=Flavobacterium zepuense TaxID=2593302 RepID=A0A552UTG4_9FLAO|nr:hypothetical protein [Flavobacterium zepuense]TRW21494.1 hypothetical protein FMM05_20300 [Flavobacterium zepuense]